MNDGIVPREICWAGINSTYYMAGIKMRIMVKEVDLWKEEIELLFNQSEFSIMSDQ